MPVFFCIEFAESEENPIFAESMTNSCGMVKARSKKYRKIHFAVMAIEASAKKRKVSGRTMYQRLKKQDIIHQRLLEHYDILHTQSLDWVVKDTLETLKNWEREDAGL